jgi:hypothetical protein
MRISTISKLVVWVILFTILLNVGFSMITMPNTIGNVIGFLIIVATVVISIKTKCLTTIKFKKND